MSHAKWWPLGGGGGGGGGLLLSYTQLQLGTASIRFHKAGQPGGGGGLLLSYTQLQLGGTALIRFHKAGQPKVQYHLQQPYGAVTSYIFSSVHVVAFKRVINYSSYIIGTKYILKNTNLFMSTVPGLRPIN